MNAARFRETLQPCRDVYPITVNLVTLEHHVAEVHTDAKLHTSVGRKARVLGFECNLDINGAVYRLDHAGELGQ